MIFLEDSNSRIYDTRKRNMFNIQTIHDQSSEEKLSKL